MMERKSSDVFMVSTDDTFASLVRDNHCAKFPSSFGYCRYHVFCTVGVGTFLWHTHLSIPDSCSQPIALPLSYRGMF